MVISRVDHDQNDALHSKFNKLNINTFINIFIFTSRTEIFVKISPNLGPSALDSKG